MTLSFLCIESIVSCKHFKYTTKNVWAFLELLTGNGDVCGFPQFLRGSEYERM